MTPIERHLRHHAARARYACLHLLPADTWPTWWSEVEVEERWGPVLGLHEGHPGERVGAFLITENGLVIFLRGGESRWVHYLDIQGFGRPPKEPRSWALDLLLEDGSMATLPLAQGGEFAFQSYIRKAIWRHERARAT